MSVESIVHACPPDGTGAMPCCGRTPFEVSKHDRISLDVELVTCTGDEPDFLLGTPPVEDHPNCPEHLRG